MDDVEQRLEELEKKRADRQKENDKKQSAQRLVDLEAREKLETEHGVGAIAAVTVARFVEGYPTCALVLCPDSTHYKKYVDQIHRATQAKNSKGQREALETLARTSWVYPFDEKERDQMFERFPGILNSIGVAATALAEGKNEEEGKG